MGAWNVHNGRLATAKGRMERGAGTGTEHGRATFMYIF